MPYRDRGGGALSPLPGAASEGRSAQEAPDRDRKRSVLRPLTAARSAPTRTPESAAPPTVTPSSPGSPSSSGVPAVEPSPTRSSPAPPRQAGPPVTAPPAGTGRAARPPTAPPPADALPTEPLPVVYRAGGFRAGGSRTDGSRSGAPRSGFPTPGAGQLSRSDGRRNAAPLFTGEAVPDPSPYANADAVPDRHAHADQNDYVAPQLPEQQRRRLPVALLALLGVAVLTVAAHAVAATFAPVWVATASEARFAVAVMAIRDATIPGVPLPPWDRFAAIQIAAVQLLLPSGDPVDTARWACLALGALATLMLWPAVRGVNIPAPATAIVVGTLGVALPMLMLHSGVTTAVVGVVWLSLATALAARGHFRAAGAMALVAVVSVPLVAAMLMAMAAAVVMLDGTLRLPSAALRVPVAVVAAVASLGVVLAAALPGAPLAASSGPIVPTWLAVTAALLVIGLVVLARLLEPALTPVFVAALPLVVVGLLAGPSRAAAAVLVTPVLAVALAIVTDHARLHFASRPLRFAMVAALVVLLAVPAAAAAGTPTPRRTPLTTWVLTQTGADTVVAADVLDRAELQAAGFPAAHLRRLTDPLGPDVLRLISDRPGAAAAPCPAGAVLANTPSGTGGAAGVICGPLTPAGVAEQQARARLGAQLTDNPSLKFEPGAAAALRDGTVDPRLMLTLAALTSAHRVGVSAFPAVPLEAPTALRRTVVLSSFDGSPPAASQLLRRWLAAQQAPFAPTAITSDGSDLVLGYAVPSPTGLLPT